MIRIRFVRPAAILAIVAVCVALATADERRTMKLDVVELIAGSEVEGDAAYAAQRDGYVYRFASAANLAAFEKNPARYEIQYGGGCGRMGALSGEGSCDLHAVHAGKLYIFASPQCRAAFLAAPEKMIESDDPAPVADDAAKARGRELLDLAVKAHGGAERIDSLATYVQRVTRQTEYQGRKVHDENALFIAFPDRMRKETHWDKSSWAHVTAGPRGAWLTDKGYDRSMAASQVRAARRLLNHNLLSVLRARRAAGFAAARVGEGKAGDTPVERVVAWFDGAAVTLGIDPKSGRVLTLAYKDWGGQRGVIGVVEKTFVDWKTVDGLTLPVAWTATHDGEAISAEPTRLTSIEVNAKLDASLFSTDPPK